MGDVVAVIPARLKSQRLPRKVLLSETGKSLIQHVWEGVSSSKLVDRVVIATDSEEVVETCRSFNAEAVITSEDCSCGTDRVAEVALKIPEASIIINAQGDEPEMQGGVLDALIEEVREHPEVEMGTVASVWPEDMPTDSPSNVKVVCNGRDEALYFSRSVIPHLRDEEAARLALLAADVDDRRHLFLRHIGMYAYRPGFLKRFSQHPPTVLELAESLEQLRALEMGARIIVANVEYHGREVNTAEEYQAFVQRYRKRDEVN